MIQQGFLILMETLMTKEIAQAIAVSGCKIDGKRGVRQ
jgi:hypothetical protein